MPTSRSRTQAAPVQPVAMAPTMRAAARRLQGRPDITKISRSAGRGWQNEAWQFYDVIGEFRYGVDWIAAMLSRATLHVTRDGERITADDSQAHAYLSAFFGGPQVIGTFLKEVATHLTVAGECYVVGTTRDGVERWHVVAATELTARGGSYYMWGKRVESDGEPLIMRLWRPHPRRWTEATSPARAILPVLSEIDQLQKHVFAQIDSRLAGAGILFLPSDLSMPAVEQADTPTGQQAQLTANIDRFLDALTGAMTASLTDRESASAVVPIVVTGSAEAIAAAKHLTFWSELQEHTKTLRDEAIRRIGLGMDLPPEVVLGTADVNHWGSWSISEQAIKAHAEPLLTLITESLTTGYLRPLLIADGMEAIEAQRYAVAADTEMMRLRPDRSKEALELWDRGAMSLAALLREMGFGPDDSPDARELVAWLARKVAQGQTTPELVEAALAHLGVHLEAGTTDNQVHEARPTRSLTEHPVTGPPQRTTTGPESERSLTPVVAAADAVVQRALERAGNRLKNRFHRQLDGVPSCEAYLHVPIRPRDCDGLLEDAFTNLPRLRVCEQVPANVLETALGAYCSHLMLTHTVHTGDALDLYLSTQLEPA